MGKILLNLVPDEPLALVQALANFDNPIQLDLLLASGLDLYVHDLTSCGMFHAELESIVSHCSLGDGVRPISEWSKLLMDCNTALFLQMQPNFVTHLKLMWHPHHYFYLALDLSNMS